MKRNSRRGGQDTYGAELTSGELIIGICVAIFAIIVALGMGIVIGKYDPSLQPEASDGVPTQPAQATTPQDSASAAVPEGVQVSPKLPPRTESVTPPNERPLPQTPPTAPPRVPELPPLPPAGTTAPAENAEVEPTSMPTEPEQEEVVEVTPATPVVPAMPASPPDNAVQEIPTPADPPAPPRDEPAATPATPPAAPADNPPSESGDPGAYGVQLAAFTGADGSAKAVDYKNKIREKLDYDARVFPSKDGKFYRVVVVGYPTKAAAGKACAEIRKIAEFQKAFVQVLPQ